MPPSALSVAGAAGIGLVWGWWAVMRLRSPRRAWLSALMLLAGSAGAAFVVHAFARRPGALAFAGAAAAAAFVHMAWRHSLRSSTSD